MPWLVPTYIQRSTGALHPSGCSTTAPTIVMMVDLAGHARGALVKLHAAASWWLHCILVSLSLDAITYNNVEISLHALTGTFMGEAMHASTHLDVYMTGS